MITERKMEKPRQNSHGLLPIHLSKTGEGRMMKEKMENLKGVGNFSIDSELRASALGLQCSGYYTVEKVCTGHIISWVNFSPLQRRKFTSTPVQYLA